jgi:hypothetical protein
MGCGRREDWEEKLQRFKRGGPVNGQPLVCVLFDWVKPVCAFSKWSQEKSLGANPKRPSDVMTNAADPIW